MTKTQLDLITLQVSPEEARKIATSLLMRSNHFADAHSDLLAREYQRLSEKIDLQRSFNLLGLETNHAK